MSEATIDERAEEEMSDHRPGMSRRNVLRAGAVGAAVVGLGAGKVLMQPSLQARGLLSKDGVFGATSVALADSLYDVKFPTSPLMGRVPGRGQPADAPGVVGQDVLVAGAGTGAGDLVMPGPGDRPGKLPWRADQRVVAYATSRACSSGYGSAAGGSRPSRTASATSVAACTAAR
jgi:hypothetical protein